MNCIVVVDKNWAIGHEGGLLFSLPTDMKRFRSLTTGGTVILGRKTLDTFPGGNPLPKRRNIIISRNTEFSREGVEVVFNPNAALELAADTEDDKLWIIGGGSVRIQSVLPKVRHTARNDLSDAPCPDSRLRYAPNEMPLRSATTPCDKLRWRRSLRIESPTSDNI